MLELHKEGSHPEPKPFQRVLPMFEEIMANVPESTPVCEEEISEEEETQTITTHQLILPGFEEFCQSED